MQIKLADSAVDRCLFADRSTNINQAIIDCVDGQTQLRISAVVMTLRFDNFLIHSCIHQVSEDQVRYGTGVIAKCQ